MELQAVVVVSRWWINRPHDAQESVMMTNSYKHACRLSIAPLLVFWFVDVLVDGRTACLKSSPGSCGHVPSQSYPATSPCILFLSFCKHSSPSNLTTRKPKFSRSVSDNSRRRMNGIRKMRRMEFTKGRLDKKRQSVGHPHSKRKR